MLSEADAAYLDGLRARLDLFADPTSVSPDGNEVRPMLNDGQLRRLRRLKRLHACMAAAEESTNDSVVGPMMPGEYSAAATTQALAAAVAEARKKANDERELKRLAAERASRLNPDLDITRELGARPSNDSLTQHNAAPSKPVGEYRSWAPDAALASPTTGGNRMGLIYDSIMEAADDDDEISEYVSHQRGLCRGCMNPVKKKGFSLVGSKWDVRFCNYTGYYYCRECHSGEGRHPIPARCLIEWDFAPRAVCDQAAEFLELMHDKPIICVSAHRPQLLEESALLATCRQLRVQLGLLHGIGVNCDRFRAMFYAPPQVKVQQSLHEATDPQAQTFVPADKRYLIEDTECWSLRDLEALHKAAPKLVAAGTMPTASPGKKGLRLTEAEQACPLFQYLRKIRTHMVRHVAQACKTCHAAAAKACAACTVEEVIFSFDVDNVVTCPRCESAFHRHCWNTKVHDGCPNCAIRAAAARNR